MDMSRVFKQFCDEDSCKAYFKQQWENEHAIYKKCASADVRWVERKAGGGAGSASTRLASRTGR